MIYHRKKDIKVFVYGTLKKGNGNHNIFLSNANFLSDAITLDNSYLLYCNGGFPMAVETNQSNCYHIKGEIYLVNSAILAELDRLEGNGFFYNREIRKFLLLDGQEVEAYIYLFMKNALQYSMTGKNIFYFVDNDDKKVINWERSKHRRY